MITRTLATVEEPIPYLLVPQGAYQDRPTPGFPIPTCWVGPIEVVRHGGGWTRWAHCPDHGWVAPSSHLLEVLSAALVR